MEEEKQLAGEDRLSGEIVEVYRQPLPGEVVERYSRPLPGRPAAPGQPRRRRRTGLWIFLACLAVVLGVAAGSWIWYLLPAGSSADPVSYTHLDVYKRQGGDMGWRLVDRYFDARGEELPCRDVYKRQVRASASRPLTKIRYFGGEMLRSFFTA